MTTRRHVLVTGGSRGIGLGLARRFLARGDRVVVTGRDPGALDAVRRTHPGVEAVVSDIGSAAQREDLATWIATRMPDVDVVIDNAGGQRRIPLATDDSPWSERAAEFDVLLAGPIHLNHLLVPLMLTHGRPSTIVTVTSGGALIPQPFAPLYSAAKAAVHSYTATLRHALEGTTIGVCELIPPAVATGLGGGPAHGATVDDYCDAAFAGIVGGADTVGFGPTDSDPVRERLRVEREMFAASSARFPVSTYADRAEG